MSKQRRYLSQAHKITPRFKELSPFRQAVMNKLINTVASEPDKMLLATIKAWVKRVGENPYYVLFSK
jgi:hypothetical protein